MTRNIRRRRPGAAPPFGARRVQRPVDQPREPDRRRAHRRSARAPAGADAGPGTENPAGTAGAARRSKSRRGLVSKKWKCEVPATAGAGAEPAPAVGVAAADSGWPSAPRAAAVPHRRGGLQLPAVGTGGRGGVRDRRAGRRRAHGTRDSGDRARRRSGRAGRWAGLGRRFGGGPGPGPSEAAGPGSRGRPGAGLGREGPGPRGRARARRPGARPPALPAPPGYVRPGCASTRACPRPCRAGCPAARPAAAASPRPSRPRSAATGHPSA
ncbi:hypothetical protein STENM223S_00131 [Streptomyces tendae]